jgi:hypothetical protein
MQLSGAPSWGTRMRRYKSVGGLSTSIPMMAVDSGDEPFAVRRIRHDAGHSLLSRRKCLTYRFRADNRPDFLVPYHGIREINVLHLLSI